MPDLEKVISDLEYYRENPRMAALHNYGALSVDIAAPLLDETIKLLRGQTPRVMALDEVLALKEGTPIYIEQSDGLHSWDVFSGIDHLGDIITGPPWATSEYWEQSDYNDTWRCWTSEPTIERMEEEKW